jgi:hypothetical protein
MLKTFEPYIPEGSACNVSIPSDPSSHLNSDLRVAEETISTEDDKIVTTDAALRFLSPGDLVPLEEEITELVGNHGLSTISDLSNIKLDVPLMPQEGNATPVDTFQADFKHLAGLVALSSSPEIAECDRVRENDKVFESELAEHATRTTQRVEQEQLEPKDALARVPVPVMDFSIPKAP